MKVVGNRDGAHEFQPRAIHASSSDLTEDYNYRSLIGHEVSDGLLRMGDQTSQGFIWDFNDEGVVIYNREHGDAKPRYRTVKWGGNIRIKEQNPTGQLVGKIAEGKAKRLGVTK